MSGAVRHGGAASSYAVRGDDAPRLIIPLVRIDGDAGASGAAADAPIAKGRGPGPHACQQSEVAANWARVAAGSADLVIALDAGGRVLAASAAAADLVVSSGADRVVGRHLLDVLDLVDFNPTPGDASMYADRIPPLLALASNALSRGLLRVRTPRGTVTLDAVAAPVHDAGGALVGAVAFLAKLGS